MEGPQYLHKEANERALYLGPITPVGFDYIYKNCYIRVSSPFLLHSQSQAAIEIDVWKNVEGHPHSTFQNALLKTFCPMGLQRFRFFLQLYLHPSNRMGTCGIYSKMQSGKEWLSNSSDICTLQYLTAVNKSLESQTGFIIVYLSQIYLLLELRYPSDQWFS